MTLVVPSEAEPVNSGCALIFAVFVGEIIHEDGLALSNVQLIPAPTVSSLFALSVPLDFIKYK